MRHEGLPRLVFFNPKQGPELQNSISSCDTDCLTPAESPGMLNCTGGLRR
jgi:hypothetical protein